MANQQTALTKAISEIKERIEQYRKDYKRYGTSYYKGKIASSVHFSNYLKSLLPYERETMEGCHKAGFIESNYTECSSSDYFNQNYTQDGK